MNLAGMSMAVGAVTGLLSAPLAIAPGASRAWLQACSRHRVLAWTVTAVDLLWSAWLVHAMPLGRFEPAKAYLWVVTPVAFVLIVWLMDELLAARAIGGLLALIPTPMLDAARWHESPWRLVIVVMAYAIAVAGMVLLLSPYRLRQAAAWALPTDRVCRGVGVAGLFGAAGLLLLGMIVFQARW